MDVQDQTELLATINKALKEAIRIMNADKGNIQLYNADENTLRIVGQQGFNRQFLEHFRIVTPSYTACGVALKRRQRVIIEDVFTDKDFAHLWPVFSAYGYVAVQSTPLLRLDKSIIGVISTHFNSPFSPKRKQFRLLDAHLEVLRQTLEQNETELKSIPGLTDVE